MRIEALVLLAHEQIIPLSLVVESAGLPKLTSDVVKKLIRETNSFETSRAAYFTSHESYFGTDTKKLRDAALERCGELAASFSEALWVVRFSDKNSLPEKILNLAINLANQKIEETEDSGELLKMFFGHDLHEPEFYSIVLEIFQKVLIISNDPKDLIRVYSYAPNEDLKRLAVQKLIKIYLER